jgi:MSHA biogenesis protein MshJ
MNLPPALEQLTARFDAMSLRERVLIALALLAAIVMLWTVAVFDALAGKQRALDVEKTSLEEQISAAKLGIETANSNDPTTLALAKEKQLQAALDEINLQLASKSAGLIPPERMVKVIHDVLSRQHGVVLVSLHNKPMTSLVQSLPPAPQPQTADEAGSEQAEPEMQAQTQESAPVESGPFVHPVEIVVEGSYLDVLAYLKALESLEWHFYWKVLDLETKRYPLNRVRIELSTLSMDKNWIGV